MQHKCHPTLLSRQGFRWQVAKRLQKHQFNFEQFLPWADTVYSLGGDNYSLDYGSAWTYFKANELILEAGKPLVLWGASVGPFCQDPKLERYAAKQLKAVHRIVVRESLSKIYLKSLGVTDNVIQLPDPAFSLNLEEADVGKDIDALLGRGAIGINLSPLLARYRPNPERWEEEAASWVTALLTQFNAPVLLIPHVMQRGNNDADFLLRIKNLIGTSEDRLQVLPGYELSSRQLKYVISRLRVFVGARTHATIAALSSNVPTLSIGYSVKAKGINLDLFGHDEWVLDHLVLNVSQLQDKLKQLLAAEDEIKAMLVRRNETYRTCLDQYPTIFEGLHQHYPRLGE